MSICEVVMNDEEFIHGYGAKSKHHDYKGEVLRNCMSVDLDVDKEVLIVAAIWHDYMKKKDYCLDADGKIQYTKYKDKIYHLSGSWAEFYHHTKLIGLDEDFIENVGHCLLSHHGDLIGEVQ